MALALDVRRAADRACTRTPWLESRHSFSFGAHYDAANTHHGLLLACNEDVVSAGAGYDPHPHRDTEVVTWVLSGSLVHEDSAGGRGVVVPGVVQRISAGRGIVHSERNDAWSSDAPAPAEPVRFVQMWVVPDEPGGDPEHEQRDVGPALAGGGLVPVASGMPGHGAALRIRNRSAALHVGRLPAGSAETLPDAPWLHLLVTRGAVDLEGAGRLLQGDAVRLTGGGGQRLRADDESEVLVWEMHARLGAAA